MENTIANQKGLLLIVPTLSPRMEKTEEEEVQK